MLTDKGDFMKSAKRHQWIEAILSQAAPTIEEEAEAKWMLYYFGEKHETSVLVSACTCGFLLMQRIEE